MQRVTSYLKPPHVSRVPCILQAVLVTLQEELEEEPGRDTRRDGDVLLKENLSGNESTVLLQ